MSVWSVDFVSSVTIPLAGLAAGLAFFFLYSAGKVRPPASLRRLLETRPAVVLSFASIAAFGATATLCALRYVHFHSALFDLGSYENKIWLVSRALPSVQSLKLSVTGHFQPILLLYAVLYKVWASPIPLLVLQALAVTSGVIPLYLLARDKLSKPGAVVIGLMYLLYPAVLFNMFFDFHPDHLFIPCALWAFYFAHRKRFAASVAMIAAGCLAKETFFLAAAFFGLYLIVVYKKYWLGSAVAAVSLLAFALAYAHVQPLRYLYDGESSYGYLATVFHSPVLFWKGLVHNLHAKFNFVQFLLFPFLYLPLLRWRELLPAAPLAAVHLLSTSLNRYSATSQYTAGFIPCILVAFVAFLHARSGRPTRIRPSAWLGMSFIVLAFMCAARGPSPLSVKFWVKPWSDQWNFSNYLAAPHDDAIVAALRLIPPDENTFVVTQNNVNGSSLPRRRRYSPFPQDLDTADYVILDSSRPPFVFDYVDSRKYADFLSRLAADPSFEQIFARDGVVVFRRKGLKADFSHPKG